MQPTADRNRWCNLGRGAVIMMMIIIIVVAFVFRHSKNDSNKKCIYLK